MKRRSASWREVLAIYGNSTAAARIEQKLRERGTEIAARGLRRDLFA
jgi:hypothetical protein